MVDNPKLDLRLVGKLLGLITHDLRNPLSALSSNLGFLSSVLPKGDRDVAEALTDGLLSCDGLSHLIDNIDVLARELQGAERPKLVPLHLAPLVDTSVTRCQSVARSHNLQLQLCADSSLAGVTIVSHPEALDCLLGNLIRNSLQHAPPRSVVRVAAGATPRGASILVQDDGVPLPDEIRDASLTAAGQLATKTQHVGRYSRGLGLYVAALAAHAAAAELSIKATDEPGHRVEIRLKRAR